MLLAKPALKWSLPPGNRQAELYDAGPVRVLSHGDITTSQRLLDFMETDQLTVP
jgi:hypothetical protein